MLYQNQSSLCAATLAFSVLASEKGNTPQQEGKDLFVNTDKQNFTVEAGQGEANFNYFIFYSVVQSSGSQPVGSDPSRRSEDTFEWLWDD